MADDEQRPRGAGWDDDEDWVRRDHGPRPEVPDHGRRPLLMALPLFLIAVAAVVAILVAGCGDDEAPTASGAGAAAGGALRPEAVASKVRGMRDVFSGRVDGETLNDTTCGAPTEGDYRCTYGGDGDPDSGTIVVRIQDSGMVSKVLGGEPPKAGVPRTDRVAELLVADDAQVGQSGVTYTCGASTAVNRDGSFANSPGAGFRCVMLDGKKPVGQRFVQFVPDGTAARDYVLTE